MAEKTAWEHVLDEPVASPPGEPPMKAEMDARFDGSFRQFVDWMNEVFKNPDDMHVRVIVGNWAKVHVSAPDPKPSISREAHRLSALSATGLSPCTPEQAERALSKIHPLAHSSRKIEAIKMVREASHCGLKEAKDFIEALPTSLHYDDEIPF